MDCNAVVHHVLSFGLVDCPSRSVDPVEVSINIHFVLRIHGLRPELIDALKWAKLSSATNFHSRIRGNRIWNVE